MNFAKHFLNLHFDLKVFILKFNLHIEYEFDIKTCFAEHTVLISTLYQIMDYDVIEIQRKTSLTAMLLFYMRKLKSNERNRTLSYITFLDIYL